MSKLKVHLYPSKESTLYSGILVVEFGVCVFLFNLLSLSVSFPGLFYLLMYDFSVFESIFVLYFFTVVLPPIFSIISIKLCILLYFSLFRCLYPCLSFILKLISLLFKSVSFCFTLTPSKLFTR